MDVFPSFSNRVKQQIISLSQLRPSLALPFSLPFSLFLNFFFLFFFFFLLVCTGLKHLYWPKQPDFAGTRPVRLIFFPVQNKGCTCTDALTDRVYTGHTGRYGTELNSLFDSDWLLFGTKYCNHKFKAGKKNILKLKFCL